MLLLHIADIHFRAPDCLKPDTDPDLVYRTRLVQDLRGQVQVLGPVGAILIGGDIAFKGAPAEYEAAMAWIQQLSATAGCILERVYVVPGNHDVDRALIARTPAVRNAQNAIRGAPQDRRERMLREQFDDPEAGGALMRPLTPYNEFAKFFNCQVYAPDRLYWKQDLELEAGVRLRISGLTSTILSGRDGGDDTAPNLYLSPLQTVLNPEDNVVNLVIAHHPPDWCMDGDAIEDAVNARAAIHLFGHKHRQRVTRDEHWVRIGAAAVNPDRHENAFDPGYNLIDVRVVGAAATRTLHITAYLRHWQDQPEGYTPRLDRNGEPLFKRSISIPDSTTSPILVVEGEEPAVAAAAEAPAAEAEAVDTEAAMSNERTRNLFYRFWLLRSSDRREIADHFGLLEEDERTLPEPERYGRALLRAGERGLIEALAEEVEKRGGK